MITIHPLRARTDNYIWVLTNDSSHHAVIVDPGEAKLVLEFLRHHSLTLSAILITHHHYDHTDGIAEIICHHPAKVYGPKHEKISYCDFPLQENDIINFDFLPLKLNVLDVPSHTQGHIAYFNENILFCGDTLFSGTCGNVFEGTYEQLYDSLMKLAHLPDDTLVYSAHEYTLEALPFAMMLEPNNKIIKKYWETCCSKKEQNLPTLPSSIGIEKQINPFLKCQEPAIMAAVARYAGHAPKNPIETLRILKQWENEFPG